MTEDATFEDGAERALDLGAMDAEDLKVLSALCQDAVLPGGGMQYRKADRRFALLLNRFRWEDHDKAAQQRRPFERVRTAIVIDSVLSVKARGLDPSDRETLFALLSLELEPGEDGAGRLILHLAGDGDLALEVECIEMALSDISKPWVAKAGAPDHKLDEPE